MIRNGNARHDANRLSAKRPSSKRRGWFLVGLSLFAGCASLNPWKDDDYELARNSVEGYEDREGNWVRPEGSRASRRANSELPKFLQDIPGLGQKQANKEAAKSLFTEADQIFLNAKETDVESDPSERRRLFREAGKKYTSAGKEWTSSALEQDAMFMAAESYFHAEDYPKAENQYAKLLKEYPRTRWQDHVDKRRMEIGHYWLQFPDRFYNLNLVDNKRPWNDTENHGKRVLEKMRLDSPTGRLADDVTMEIANTEFKRENWNEALEAYRDLVSIYPDSPHRFDAYFLGAKAALMAYQGAQYTKEPLDDADKMLKDAVKQFPEKSQENKDQIRQMMAEVKFRQAERLYDEALYRANKEEYDAASIYCNQIVADYDDTPFSEKAKAILAKGEGKPGVPTPYLYWMTTVFPSRSKIDPLIKAGQIPGPTNPVMANPGAQDLPGVMAAGSSSPKTRTADTGGMGTTQR